MDCSVLEVECDHTAALAILHDEVHGEVFDEVVAVVAQRLSVKGVEQ